MMDSFERLLLKVTTVVAIVVSLIAYVFDSRIGIGILLGCACAQLSFMMMSIQLTAMLNAKHFNRISFGLVYIIRLSCIALPLLLSALKPEKSNIWAVFAGFMIHKLLIYILGFIIKEDDSIGN